MKNKTLIQRILSVVFLVFLAVGTVLILRKSNAGRWQEDSGPVFGTFYSVKYQSPERFDKEIREVLAGVDASFSIFNDSSTVSRLNHGDSTFSDTLSVNGSDAETGVSEAGSFAHPAMPTSIDAPSRIAANRFNFFILSPPVLFL